MTTISLIQYIPDYTPQSFTTTITGLVGKVRISQCIVYLNKKFNQGNHIDMVVQIVL